MENISINHVDLQTKIIAQDILDKSSSQPIYLSSVEVVGGETFSNVFFKKLLSPLLETSDYTFGKLVSNVEASYNKLKDTEVFTDIGVSFSTDFTSGIPSNVKNYNSKTDKPIPTKVKFDVKSINLNIGEYFLNLDNDTPLNVNLHYLNNNFNSNAELINVGVDYNPYKPNQHLVTNGKLISNLTNPRFKFVIDLFNTNQNNKIWQKSSENSLGGVIGLQYNNTSRNLHFLTGLSILKRKLHDMDDSTIDDVKLFAGDNIKSSIINELSYSNLSFLNSATNNFPVNGFNFLLSNELSSNQQLNDPSSDSGYFCKSSFTSNIFKTFANNYLTLKISNSFGSIYNPLLEELSPVHVSDRFYLGGSKSFKGYSKNSINANGGNQFYKLDSSLFLKLPHFLYSPKHNQNNEANPLRLYVNGIAGNVSDNLLDDSSLSTSVGFGLKYFNNWAHFDLGYYLSKKINNVDQLGVKDGLQFSLSVGGSNRSSF
ncbi:hypothetical protein CANTEDRAFT_106260 [Yamadazyma tenuis ATCC 10573]|uniref:Bacterial surface antigen (D15) domain-containing protein n=2 Tax=Candida tenuis TaxID=2315449 RepID=G3B5R6_CANTC|nr:uncharacterized protein CANTEDRAFT_106260 [Yamadazyma tenuis ATCC 10573]EGV63290.1 hypothetical protein CANTEDRAFT_106260 [Yamadazyma tenuis ATCC 10573]